MGTAVTSPSLVAFRADGKIAVFCCLINAISKAENVQSRQVFSRCLPSCTVVFPSPLLAATGAGRWDWEGEVGHQRQARNCWWDPRNVTASSLDWAEPLCPAGKAELWQPSLIQFSLHLIAVITTRSNFLPQPEIFQLCNANNIMCDEEPDDGDNNNNSDDAFIQ